MFLGVPRRRHAGASTLNTFGGQYTTFKLAPNASITIEIGDLFQETGVSGSTGELEYSTRYQFTAFAIDGNGAAASALGNTVHPPQPDQRADPDAR
jgi:hypothetical protein